MEGALMREATSTNYTTTQIHPSLYFQLHVTVIKRYMTADFIIHLPDSPIDISFRILKTDIYILERRNVLSPFLKNYQLWEK